ncbi:MAG: cytochrome c [Chloroflexi bacterium]|nr:cytochrome c [Chloroflexota bacterium]
MGFRGTRHRDALTARVLFLLFAMTAFFGLVASACITKRGTYPIEVFPEQHYSQAYRYQEQPRIPPAPDAVVFEPAGADKVLEVPERRQHPYDPKVAAELYRVNCSVCHGPLGLGDGPIVPHLTSPDSFYANLARQPYARPPNLQETRASRDEKTVFSIITSGVVVMPRFGLLLTEEERWDLVRYIFDTQTGLGK